MPYARFKPLEQMRFKLPPGMHVRPRDFDEIAIIQLISLTGGLLAGYMLASGRGILVLVPGLLIMMPGFLEMMGNISGTMAARLSSGLFLGAVKPTITNQSMLRGNVIGAVALSAIVSLFLGLVAFAINWIFFGAFYPNIILVAIFAGLLANAIEIPLTIFSTFWLFKHGHDPNNIMGPYLTVVGDMVSVTSLLIAIAVLI